MLFSHQNLTFRVPVGSKPVFSRKEECLMFNNHFCKFSLRVPIILSIGQQFWIRMWRCIFECFYACVCVLLSCGPTPQGKSLKLCVPQSKQLSDTPKTTPNDRKERKREQERDKDREMAQKRQLARRKSGHGDSPGQCSAKIYMLPSGSLNTTKDFRIREGVRMKRMRERKKERAIKLMRHKTNAKTEKRETSFICMLIIC